MAKQINLGKVVGDPAKINGQNAITLEASNGVELTQDGSKVTLKAPGIAEHAGASNPHNITKSTLGLDKVENKSAATILGEMTKENVTEALGYTPPTKDTTYGAATESAPGLMPAADKAKVNKIIGTENQFLGFDASGNPVARDIAQDMTAKSSAVFGFELDFDESDPYDRVRYIGENATYQPAYMDMTADKFESGDWANVWFLKNIKPVILNFDGTVNVELDRFDYTKTVNGADATIDENCAGNVMVGIPTVYMKVDVTAPRKPKFYFAATKVDDSYHAYAHTDANGNIMPYFYRAAYDGWVDTDNKLRSVSGKSPTRSQSGTVQIQEARANNPEGVDIWDIDVLADRQLLSLLCVLIGKSTDTQSVFGLGNENGYNDKPAGSDGNGVLPTGTMNDKGLFWGSSKRNLGVKVFGIEHFWGNIWKRTAGLILDNGVMKCKMTKGTADGSTATDYNETGEGYINLGFTPVCSNLVNNDYYYGYISDMKVNDFGLFMSTLNGSSTTKYCDAGWFRTTDIRFALFGGGSGSGSACGAFACSLNVLVSYSLWGYGASVSCKPEVAAFAQLMDFFNI